MMSDGHDRVRVRICGRVHGVGFRKWLKRRAFALGITASFKNTDFGVETTLSGPRAAIDRLIEALWLGPSGARVDQIVIRRPECAKKYGKTILQSDPFAWGPSLIKKYSNTTKAKSDELDRLCEKMVRCYREQKGDISGVMNTITTDVMNSKLDNKRDIATLLLNNIWPSDVNLEVLESVEIPLRTSFRTALIRHWVVTIEARRSGGRTPSSLLDDKMRGKAYVRSLGISTPAIHQANVPHQTIRITPGIVIKPARSAASKGVFQVDSNEKIYDVERAAVLDSENSLFERMRETISTFDLPDLWLVEEFVEGEGGNPPNDLKFYCFYGNIPLILEIQRFPRPGWNFLDSNGFRVDTGKYELTQFEGGKGFTTQDLELAMRISKSIPTPFMRIDFMRNKKNALIFGEFAAKPGNFHEFNNEYDKALGACFMDAEARLYQDFLSGVEFSEFKEFVGTLRSVEGIQPNLTMPQERHSAPE